MSTITADPRLACEPDCASCVSHPGHQETAYRLGLGYGRTSTALDVQAEAAYWQRRAAEVDPLARAYVLGIADALTALAAS